MKHHRCDLLNVYDTQNSDSITSRTGDVRTQN